MPIKSRIRTIPDHPKPGIQFRDITTLLQDPVGLRISVEGLVKPFRGQQVEKVVAIEARGFILGGAVAVGLGAGVVPVRKRGKRGVLSCPAARFDGCVESHPHLLAPDPVDARPAGVCESQVIDSGGLCE